MLFNDVKSKTREKSLIVCLGNDNRKEKHENTYFTYLLYAPDKAQVPRERSFKVTRSKNPNSVTRDAIQLG